MLLDRLTDKSGGPDACWPWLGHVDRGYGRIGKRSAHRVSYIRERGVVPNGMELDHACHPVDGTCVGGFACEHRRCVNPRHLVPASHRENTLRGVGPTAVNARKAACPRGHEYTPDNTYVWAGPGRVLARICRACRTVAA